MPSISTIHFGNIKMKNKKVTFRSNIFLEKVFYKTFIINLKKQLRGGV